MPSIASSTESLGVGIVGLSTRGGWAAAAHVPALTAIEGLRLVGATGSSPESSRRTAAALGLPRVLATVDELVNDPEVELVVVAVKVPDHELAVRASIEAGKPVLIEWPIAPSAEVAEQLAERAAAAGVRGFVGLHAWASPFHERLARRLAEMQVRSTTIIGAAMRWGPTFNAASRYQLDAANGATLVTIPLAHTISALTHALGPLAEVHTVTATRFPAVRDADSGEEAAMTAPDQLTLTGRLSGGGLATVHLEGGPPTGEGFQWQIRTAEEELLLRSDWTHPQFGELVLTDGDGNELDRQEPSPASAVAATYRRIAADLRDNTHTAPALADGVRLQRMLADSLCR